MKRIRFGEPEAIVPSLFCKDFRYCESEISYPVDRISFEVTHRGTTLVLPLKKEEQIYGLGLQLKQFNHRRKKLTCRVNADPVGPSGDSHAPVPFFVSTAGYGIYVDTARFAEFYFGSSEFLDSIGKPEAEAKIGTSTEELYAARENGESNISIQIPYAKGVDIYIIEGKNITDVVAQYNLLSGGGCDVPDWGLEPLYRCYTKFTEDQVLAMAEHFKERDLPIGILGLEPGWQTHTYSCSYLWDTERYPKHTETVRRLREMGYHVNLWEHAFVHPTSPVFEPLLKYSANYGVWGGCVPDLSLPEAREIFAEYQKTLIDEGVDGFKLDECDGSDYTGGWTFPNMAKFPSGMDGEQYHSLFGVLYMQTMLEALDGKPTLSEVRNAGALSASYPFVLYSDLYDHKDFIRGVVTSGFSGILWTPEVRDAKSKEELLRRLQSTVFSVQCLINAWYVNGTPWETLDCEDEVRELLRLRMKLVPMLSKAFKKYKEEGIPPVRALVSDYTDDENVYKIDDEYLFCENLLVAPIAVSAGGRDVYLPRGTWVDFFTKEPVENGHFHVETEGIPVYERIGE